MAEVRLSPAAEDDLEGIFDYTVQQWGLEQAVHYTQLIEQTCTGAWMPLVTCSAHR